MPSWLFNGRHYHRSQRRARSGRAPKEKTISTRVTDDASLMTKRFVSTLQSEMIKERMKWVLHGGEITMDVAMGNGQHGNELFRNFSPNTGFSDVVVANMRASERGHVFLEAQVSGSGEYLNGEVQPGCIREFLRNHLGDNATQEERCYKNWWP